MSRIAGKCNICNEYIFWSNNTYCVDPIQFGLIHKRCSRGKL